MKLKLLTQNLDNFLRLLNVTPTLQYFSYQLFHICKMLLQCFHYVHLMIVEPKILQGLNLM